MRPSDPPEIKGQPSKARNVLPWAPKIKGSELAINLIDNQMERKSSYKKISSFM